MNKRGLQFIEVHSVKLQPISPKKNELSSITVPSKSPPSARHVGSSSQAPEKNCTLDDDDFDNVPLSKRYSYRTPCPSVKLRKPPSSNTGKVQSTPNIDKVINAPDGRIVIESTPVEQDPISKSNSSSSKKVTWSNFVEEHVFVANDTVAPNASEVS